MYALHGIKRKKDGTDVTNSFGRGTGQPTTEQRLAIENNPP